MQIGIIDSGISPGFIALSKINIISAASFSISINDKQVIRTEQLFRNELSEPIPNILLDNTGHGTAVTSILWRHCPFAEYVIAKILLDDNSAYSCCFIEALRWMVEETNVRIINASVACEDNHLRTNFSDIIAIAEKKNIRIFSSMLSTSSLPATIPPVVPIATYNEFPNYIQNISAYPKCCFNKKRNIIVWDSGYWSKKNMCSSYACAVATAEYAKHQISRHVPFAR